MPHVVQFGLRAPGIEETEQDMGAPFKDGIARHVPGSKILENPELSTRRNGRQGGQRWISPTS